MIPKEHQWRFIFHMTDIRNLDSIIKNGLLSTNNKESLGIKHQNIANLKIQERRDLKDIPCGPKGKLHDYVPFYFSSMNPMLLGVINSKNYDQPLIIYLCMKIQRLEKDDAVFSKASLNTSEDPEIYDDCEKLSELNWELIDSGKWSYKNKDERHQKMAEALIKDKVRIDEIDAIVVFNKYIKEKVERIFKDNNINPPKICYSFGLDDYHKYAFYYTKFFLNSDQKRSSLITGPKLLYHLYKNLLKEIKNKRAEFKSFKYTSISDFINALDIKFDSIEELAGIKGLVTSNNEHKEDVETHTKNVVKEIRNIYSDFSEEDKQILVVSAYLHDIGKGPKSKWKDGIQLPYPDHPADAIPMLERILSEEITEISDDDIRKICMLVVYHDIVGDCICKGRDKEQISKIISNGNDLDLLITIALADTKTINKTWYQIIYYSRNKFKNSILKKTE